jgi:hypothetical protein
MTDAPNPAPRRVRGPREQQAVVLMRGHRVRVMYERAALPCAYGDAAHLLDAIRADRKPQKPLRGESARIEEAVCRALKDAADAIWSLRDDSDD